MFIPPLIHQMPYVSRFREALDFEADIDELAKSFRIALYAEDVSTFFTNVGLIKERFREVERKIADEVSFLNFIRQCERSDLLLATLWGEYLKAKVRYKWLNK
jgi:hypothetical protein